METAPAELARPQKAGLLRALPAGGHVGRGTQAPGEGFALTIAERECAKLVFEHEHDLRDVILGVGLVAAKRASLVGRGPQLGDVHVAMDHFGLRDLPVVGHTAALPFRGLAHSYVLQRRLVDSVSDESLLAPSSADPVL
jgi:hypothetical protein